MHAHTASEHAEPRLDHDAAIEHSAHHPTNAAHEEARDQLHRPAKNPQRLYEPAACLLRGSGAFHIGGKQSDFAAARKAQLIALRSEPIVSPPDATLNFVGGEHQVFMRHAPVEIFKQTLPGFYGRILDEKMLLDARTILNVRKLAMRGALPAEYLRRLTGLLIPVDLVITVIPSGACKILPEPDAEWQPIHLRAQP